MKMPKLPRWVRWLVLGSGGALVLAAAATDVDNTPEVPAKQGARQQAPSRVPATAAGGDAAPVAPAQRLELERLEPTRQATGDATGNVFGATSWYVPPPPPPAAPPLPTPTPTAPPLPFTYLGIYADAGVPVLILAKGDRVYTVSPGGVIDGTYRVESVTGRSAELTFLPLSTKQTLAVGGT